MDNTLPDGQGTCWCGSQEVGRSKSNMWEGHLWEAFAGTRSLNSMMATFSCKLQPLHCPLHLCLSCTAVILQSKQDGWKSKCGCPAFNSSYVWVQSICALTFSKALDLPKHIPNKHLRWTSVAKTSPPGSCLILRSSGHWDMFPRS